MHMSIVGERAGDSSLPRGDVSSTGDRLSGSPTDVPTFLLEGLKTSEPDTGTR